SPSQLQTLRDLIEASRGLGPSLVELSAACGLQPRQLSERFKNSLGITLRQYIAESRINKARALLQDDQLLIKEVAYICGFQNAAAFTAAFRKATALTPQEFREGAGMARHRGNKAPLFSNGNGGLRDSANPVPAGLICLESICLSPHRQRRIRRRRHPHNTITGAAHGYAAGTSGQGSDQHIRQGLAREPR